MFSERNPVVIGIVTVALIAAATVAALTLDRRDFTGGYALVGEFTTANGLRTGDSVSIAGVKIGTVTGLRITDDHVEVDMAIDGTDLPVGTRAALEPQTLVGKRGIELDGGGDWSQLLGDGGVIPLARTTVATDVPTFGDASTELLSEIDAEALNQFLRALADVTRGQREQVADLVSGGTRLTSVVNDQEAEINQLLGALESLGATLNSRDTELLSIIDDFNLVLDNVVARRADLVALFEETNRSSAVAADLVATNRVQLDQILDELHRDLAIVNDNQLSLAEAIAYAPDAIGGFASIAFADDQRVPWGHVFVQSVGPLGVGVLLGCGGLLDMQLDQILGPDPRSCEQQDGQTLPDDVDEFDDVECSGAPPPPEGCPQDPDNPGALVPGLPPLFDDDGEGRQGLEGIVDGVLPAGVRR